MIRAPNWLGDAVMALPAMAAVRAGYPGASLAVAAISSVAPLFLEQTAVGPDEVLAVDPRTEQAQLRNRQVRRGRALAEFVSIGMDGAARRHRRALGLSRGRPWLAADASCRDGRARTSTRQRTTSTSRVVWISP